MRVAYSTSGIFINNFSNKNIIHEFVIMRTRSNYYTCLNIQFLTFVNYKNKCEIDFKLSRLNKNRLSNLSKNVT